MNKPVAPLSDRLEDMINRSNLRNFRATARHFDAAAEADFADGVQHREEGAYDRYVRSMVEGAICWRDVNARVV